MRLRLPLVFPRLLKLVASPTRTRPVESRAVPTTAARPAPTAVPRQSVAALRLARDRVVRPLPRRLRRRRRVAALRLVTRLGLRLRRPPRRHASTWPLPSPSKKRPFATNMRLSCPTSAIVSTVPCYSRSCRRLRQSPCWLGRRCATSRCASALSATNESATPSRSTGETGGPLLTWRHVASAYRTNVPASRRRSVRRRGVGRSCSPQSRRLASRRRRRRATRTTTLPARRTPTLPPSLPRLPTLSHRARSSLPS
mmetsp:Transcript_16500/g.51622  ORF Transcript_16500/g.51622 Transcript_16500/m.51622 type:complete len:255 (-) Transcript_16500:1186-1950(-)